MRRAIRSPFIPVALAAALLGPASAVSAATVVSEPSPAAARTFAGGAPGWTTAVDRDGICVLGLTCPAVTQGHVASGGTGGPGGGFIRTRVGRLVSVASAATGVWRSPAFTPAAPADRVRFSLALRSDVDGLVAVDADARLDVRLVDLADPSRSRTVLSRTLADTAGFAGLAANLSAGAVVAGRSYRLDLRTRVGALAAVPVVVTTDVDDVRLQLADLLAPTDLIATVPAGGAPRVAGSVDPHGQATTVSVDFGPTAGYGAAAGPVEVTGDGPQAFTLPLAGLTPGMTYHYRVTATNLDGSVATADATFVAPVAPPDAPPLVTGAWNRRERDVTFDVGGGVTAADVEIRRDGALVGMVADTPLDGELAITLPDLDGTYDVRVVRHGATSDTTSAYVPVVLDRVGPATGALSLRVTPVAAAATTRVVSFEPPADAVSATAQVLDGHGDPVGPGRPMTGGGGDVELGPADGAYRVEVTFADAAGNEAAVTSGELTLDRSAGSGPGGPGTGTPGTGAPGGTGTATPGGAGSHDPGGYAAVLGACFRSDVAITKIRTVGRRVRLSGIAALPAGTRIVVRAVRGKRLGTSAVRADGTFRATVRPPAARHGRRARIRARAGTARSNAVFVKPVNALTSVRVRARTVTVRGRVNVQRLGGQVRFSARGGRGAAGCARGGRKLKVRAVRIDRRTGAYRLRVRVPAGSGRIAVRTRALGRFTAYSSFAIR